MNVKEQLKKEQGQLDYTNQKLQRNDLQDWERKEWEDIKKIYIERIAELKSIVEIL